jgi:hypothetical protein
MRRLLNDYPGLTTAISIALLLLALAIVGLYLWPRNIDPASPPATDESTGDPHAAACAAVHGSEQAAAR